MSNQPRPHIRGAGRRAVALGLIGLLAVAGCSSDETGVSSDGAVQVTIAEQQIADFAPVWLGVSEGFFADEGLEVEVVSGAASSAGQVPLVLSGQADLAATTATTALQSNAENIPVRIVGGLTTFGATPAEDQGGLIAAADSQLASYADLEHTTVAVSGLQSVTHAIMQAAIAQAGGDPSTVEFIQAPMPNIPNLVATGGADAGFVVDPFLATASADGMALLGRPAHEVAAGFPSTSIIAADDYTEDNPEVLTRFQRALTTATDYAAANPDAVVAAVAESVGLPAEQLAAGVNPAFGAHLDVALLAAEAEMLATFGGLPRDVDVDVDAIVWSPSADG